MILDRSGSMQSIYEPTIEGFNEFINQQRNKVIGDCVVSLHQFDDVYQTDYTSVDIKSVKKLDYETYVPRGMTALLDAIGNTISELGKTLACMSEAERPDTVIVAILTDGHENASSEFTMQKINELIKHQTDKYDWEFIFLGANQDAIATASSYGIKAGNVMTYTPSDHGTRNAFSSMGDGLIRKRRAKAVAYQEGASIKEAALLSKRMETFDEDDRRKQSDSDLDFK